MTIEQLLRKIKILTQYIDLISSEIDIFNDEEWSRVVRMEALTKAAILAGHMLMLKKTESPEFVELYKKLITQLIHERCLVIEGEFFALPEGLSARTLAHVLPRASAAYYDSVGIPSKAALKVVHLINDVLCLWYSVT